MSAIGEERRIVKRRRRWRYDRSLQDWIDRLEIPFSSPTDTSEAEGFVTPPSKERRKQQMLLESEARHILRIRYAEKRVESRAISRELDAMLREDPRERARLGVDEREAASRAAKEHSNRIMVMTDEELEVLNE